RTLWIEGVSNTRDLGGWKTADGKQRVKYGIAYRGAKFDDITPAGKQAILDLGLKTDVDLRGHNEGIDEPLASIGVNHIFGSTYGCAMYNGTDSTSIERFGSNHVNGTINALRAYANPANYPAYFHCSYGRDRTGTLGLLLLGLLGVSKVDIQKDYEMTFLSEWGGGGLSAVGHTDILNRTISWLANRYKCSTLQENVEAYVLEAGLTAEEVAAIRANMLERASTLAGDVDYDGTVGVTDALMSLRASLGLAEIAEEDFSYADADGDGIITVSDVLVILRIAAYIV
ncbi:MAG: tyrosine-protein phosphatase, partial [Clostridia bacterium]|nr:tyrosine-protein phosphatase [Clostridia bacterium]